MPVSFQFTDKTTKEIKLLADIDAEVCATFGRPVHPTRFSPEYDILTDIGIDCCFNGAFSDSRFREIVQKLDADIAEKVLFFLNGKYEFRAWR